MIHRYFSQKNDFRYFLHVSLANWQIKTILSIIKNQQINLSYYLNFVLYLNLNFKQILKFCFFLAYDLWKYFLHFPIPALSKWFWTLTAVFAEPCSCIVAELREATAKRTIPFPALARGKVRCLEQNLVLYANGYPLLSVVPLLIFPVRLKFTP